MKSKIGRRLLLTLLICVAVSVAAINTIAMFMSSNFSESLMLMHTKAGAVTLRRELTQQVERLENIQNIVSFSLDEVTNDTLTGFLQYDGDFFGYYTADGALSITSDNYNLSDIDPAGAEYNGVVLDKTGL